MGLRLRLGVVKFITDKGSKMKKNYIKTTLFHGLLSITVLLAVLMISIVAARIAYAFLFMIDKAINNILHTLVMFNGGGL